MACSKQRLCPYRGSVHAGVKQKGQNTVWPLPNVQHTGEKHMLLNLSTTQIHISGLVNRASTNPHAAEVIPTTQVAILIQVMKYSFCLATSKETKPWRTLQYILYVTRSLFSPSEPLFFWQACFVDCFSSACCPFYLCLPPFFPPLSFSFCICLSLDIVWVVRPVIELPLFDQGSNRNCTLLTQLCWYAFICVCVWEYISGRCTSLCVVMYIIYACQ